MFNFAKMIGEPQLDYLSNVLSIHVPWDEIAVSPSDFHRAAKISAGLPWLKVALLTAQYLSPKERIAPGPFNKGYGATVTVKDFERIAVASRGQGASAAHSLTNSLSAVEAFLGCLVTQYLGSPVMNWETLTLERSQQPLRVWERLC
jgi:hypothetical protein